MVLRNGLRNPSGRRYEKEEQILCLSIYKTSAKAYRYLRTFLPFPSVTTLKKILKNISMDAGVTEETRLRLKTAGQAAVSDKEKAVVVMWDELLLGLGLHYDECKDKVVGFEDWGNVRTNKFADHGHDTERMKGSDYILQCKSIILNTFIFLKITVTYLNIVLKDGCFILFDMEIIPLFDPPHLIKCVRNNLIDKDLEFDVHPSKKSTERKFASWQDIVNVYEIDIYGLQNQRFLPKLTDRHIYPNKIKKMRVKNAIQVFSLSVASRLEGLAGGRGTISFII
ncbi:uncharacterized protein LOC127277973 [Leptopilina boulardi]|uniref:uncharacterized protein LOC127277973 n=1 Tax=Leptopilina boulardi TaxID=63433 RepID=UPI0021F57DBE|nr:uncharacterized protein LOC127277973 [Leptopilina boulardi]